MTADRSRHERRRDFASHYSGTGPRPNYIARLPGGEIVKNPETGEPRRFSNKRIAREWIAESFPYHMRQHVLLDLDPS